MKSSVSRSVVHARLLTALFVVLTLLQLVPVWFVRYLPTGDGPCHLYNAWLVRRLASGEANGAIASYYRIDWRPIPNWTAEAFMAAAMSVLPSITAEKLLFSLILLLFLGGAWMFAGVTHAQDSAYAFLALPFAYNQLLQAGFYNFSLSVGLYLVIIALWWKRRDNPSLRTIIFIGLLLLLCYFSHPMSTALAIGSIVLLWLSSARGRPLGRHALHLIAVVPASALLLWFVSTQRKTGELGRIPQDRLISYLTQTLYTFDHRQIIFVRAFLILMVTLILATFALENMAFIDRRYRWRFGERDSFLVVLAAMVLLYVLAPPEAAGGAFIHERMALFVVIAPLAWLSPRLQPAVRTGIIVAFSIAAIINAGFQLRHFRSCSRKTEVFLEALRTAAPNSVVLPLLFKRSTPDAYIGFHVHAIDYVAIEKRLVDLDNYQPGTGYFPVAYRASAPTPNIFEIESGTERINLDDYRHANYVFTWRMPPDVSLRATLDSQYQLVAQSGGGRLYRRGAVVPSPSPKEKWPLAREVILLPVAGTSEDLVFRGARWRVEQTVRNSGRTTVHLRLTTCALQTSCDLDISPGQTVAVASDDNRPPYGLVELERGTGDQLVFSTVVEGIGAEGSRSRMVVPAVRERDLRRKEIIVPSVSFARDTRLNLRVWAEGTAPAVYAVSVVSGKRRIRAREPLRSGADGYFTDPDLRARFPQIPDRSPVDVIVEVQAAPTDRRLWAFVTETDNRTDVARSFLPR